MVTPSLRRPVLHVIQVMKPRLAASVAADITSGLCRMTNTGWLRRTQPWPGKGGPHPPAAEHWPVRSVLNFAYEYSSGGEQERRMNGLIYLIGLIVVVMAILSFLGLR
jgi:hypothetical protein